MANECIPYYEAGQEITAKSSAAVTGCRFVKLDGASTWTPEGLKDVTNPVPSAGLPSSNVCDVLPATAGSKGFGVAGRDAAIGKPFMVITGPGIVVPVEVGAALVPGNEVELGANGVVIPATTGIKVGLCMSKQATVGQKAAIKLY